MSPFTREECIRGGKTSGKMGTAVKMRPDIYTKAFYQAMGRASAEKRGCPKLPESTARVIADLHRQGLSIRALAKSFRVHQASIRRAIQRVT